MSLRQTSVLFVSMVGVLFLNKWARPSAGSGIWFEVFRMKWYVAGLFAAILAFCVWRYMHPPTIADWGRQTWRFARQILPLLFAGVLVAGFLLGGPHATDAGMIPSAWVQALVGDSPDAFLRLSGLGEQGHPWIRFAWPVWTNLFASFAGALMYFATLTEVPILRGLLDSGMGKGPALALLLAGPALSLPNMFVIHSILGFRKTTVYVGLVVVMATISGLIFGFIV